MQRARRHPRPDHLCRGQRRHRRRHAGEHNRLDWRAGDRRRATWRWTSGRRLLSSNERRLSSTTATGQAWREPERRRAAMRRDRLGGRQVARARLLGVSAVPRLPGGSAAAAFTAIITATCRRRRPSAAATAVALIAAAIAAGVTARHVAAGDHTVRSRRRSRRV